MEHLDAADGVLRFVFVEEGVAAEVGEEDHPGDDRHSQDIAHAGRHESPLELNWQAAECRSFRQTRQGELREELAWMSLRISVFSPLPWNEKEQAILGRDTQVMGISEGRFKFFPARCSRSA
jgi:hypothetical protein